MALKMIIADDDREACAALSEGIDWSSCGVEVVGISHNGSDLVKLCKDKKPDLCIVDIGMPILDGLEAIDRIKPQLSKTKFIILSGSQDFEDARHALISGAVTYLLKPLNKALIYQSVKETAMLIRNEKKQTELLNFAHKHLLVEKQQLAEAFFNKWISKAYSEDEIAFGLDNLELGDISEYLLLLVEHPEFPMSTFEGAETADPSTELYRAIRKSLKIKSKVLWVPLNARRALAIIKSPVDSEPVSAENLNSVFRRQGIRFYLTSRQIHSIKGEFLGAYESMIQEMELEIRSSPIIRAVEAMILSDYSNKDLSLQFIADLKHMNPQYLSRIFKNETGMTFSLFLTRTRLDQACRLALGSDLTVQEISEAVGYSSHHYFSTAFKKMMGMTPTEFRVVKSTART